MVLSPEQQAELSKIRADVREVHDKLKAIDYETEKALVKERVVVADLETIRKQVLHLVSFYYQLEERLLSLIGESGVG